MKHKNETDSARPLLHLGIHDRESPDTVHHCAQPRRACDPLGSGGGGRYRCDPPGPGWGHADAMPRRRCRWRDGPGIAGPGRNASSEINAWSRADPSPAWTRSPPSSLRSIPRVRDSTSTLGRRGTAHSTRGASQPLDSVSGPGNGGTAAHPFAIDAQGTVQYEGSTDAVLRDGRWSVDLGLFLLPKFSGRVTNSSGLRTRSSTESVEKRLPVPIRRLFRLGHGDRARRRAVSGGALGTADRQSRVYAGLDRCGTALLRRDH